MINLNCSNCRKNIPFDPLKYPSQILSITCPNCKNKISYDNRQKSGIIPLQPELLKNMPPLREKNALIICADESYIPLIKEGIEALGFFVKAIFKTPEESANFISQELPSIVIVFMENLPPPPFKILEPVQFLPPNIRRNIFLAVIASNVKSLDGNSAFLYQVNLLINTKDINVFHHHILSGLIFEYNLKAHFKKSI